MVKWSIIYNKKKVWHLVLCCCATTFCSSFAAFDGTSTKNGFPLQAIWLLEQFDCFSLSNGTSCKFCRDSGSCSSGSCDIFPIGRLSSYRAYAYAYNTIPCGKSSARLTDCICKIQLNIKIESDMWRKSSQTPLMRGNVSVFVSTFVHMWRQSCATTHNNNKGIFH